MKDDIRRFNPEPMKVKNKYQNLSSIQVKMIDEALSAVGNYGEVRLIVDKGRLHFLVTQKSFDALKYRPGTIKDKN